MSASTLPLPALFLDALAKAARAQNLPTVADETQALVLGALADLRAVAARVDALALFSPNEAADDIATRDLLFLLAPFAAAELLGRVRTSAPPARIDSLQRAQSSLQAFVAQLDAYGLVPPAERALYARPAAAVQDAARRRELKIQQYKAEKELRANIEAVRRRRSPAAPDADSEPGSTLDLITSLLSAVPSADADDDEADDALRSATLLLLRLVYAQAHAALESGAQELALLRSMPAAPPAPAPDPGRNASARDVRRAEDDMWRLDAPPPAGGPDGRGPLLDSGGKPLRPFTILPAGAGERARLQAQVFGPDHRLPTMGIDEYLAIERERGNVITGGGPQSETAPTTSEQLAADSEMDGSALAEARGEEKRRKDEDWARFTEANPRGAGNTMNRG